MNSNFPIRMLDGVGVVASKKRSINLSNTYDQYFPKPNYYDPILVHNGENEMTIDQFIPKIVREYSSDTEKIAELLAKSNIEATCRSIFDFIYKNIQYNPDSPHEEQIRRPARTWADRVRGVDCDCYTTFISSILTNLRIPHYLRMAAYNPTRGFQHIYVIVPKNPKNLRGEYFTIDPVLDRFNEEKKPFTKVHDKLMKPVSALSVGVNGFPIRMLNGGINLRSPLVYDEVLYSPSLGTWALRGVDGGYYIEGDFQRRYIEPLDGVGVGWLSTALKVGKGIFKAGKKIVKKIKRRRAEKKADKNQAKEEAQNRVARAGKNLQQRVANSQTDNDNIIDRMDKDTTDSIMQEFANSQVELDEKLKNLNKSTILSLQSLDKGTKEKISEVVNELSPEINKLIEEGASSKEIVQKAAQASQAILMNTNTLNKKDEERTKDIIQTVEQTARDQQAAIGKQATSQKFILIAIGALALVVVFTMIKGNKQPNI